MIVQEPIQVGLLKILLTVKVFALSIIPGIKIFKFLQVIVWDCLNNYEYDNAIFLAERLHAEGKDCSFFICYTLNEQIIID